MAEILRQTAEPAPQPITKEVIPSKEILSRDRAGVQAALLLDGLMPGAGVILDKSQLQDKREKIKKGSFETTKITNGSKHERDEYWKKTEYKNFDAQKKAWIDKTNKFLEGFDSDDKKGEREILEKLGMRKGGAEEIYKVYFGEEKDGGHKGDVGYFAMRVADKLSPDEIRRNTKLLQNIGGFYGKDSAEVARLLSEGVKNVKEDETFDEFAKEAIAQFNEGEKMGGIEIIRGVNERSGKWMVKQKEEEERKRKAEAAKKVEEERLRLEKQKKEEAAEKERQKKAQEGKKQEPEIQSEKEKDIRGTIDSLLKIKDGLFKEANERRVDFRNEKQLEQIRNTWGKDEIDKYNEGCKALKEKIVKALQSGEVTAVSSKYEKLKQGDIIDLANATKPGEIVWGFYGKFDVANTDEKAYYFLTLGQGLEFDRGQKDMEGSVKDHELTKLVFVNKEQKPKDEYAGFREDVLKNLHLGKGGHLEENKKISEQIKGDEKRFPAFLAVMENEIKKAKDFNSLDSIVNNGWNILQLFEIDGKNASNLEREGHPIFGDYRKGINEKIKDLGGEGKMSDDDKKNFRSYLPVDKLTVKDIGQLEQNEQEMTKRTLKAVEEQRKILEAEEGKETSIKEAFRGWGEGFSEANIKLAERYDTEIRNEKDLDNKKKLIKDFYNNFEEPWTDDFSPSDFRKNYPLKNDLRKIFKEKFDENELQNVLDTVLAGKKESEKIGAVVNKEDFDKAGKGKIEFDKIKDLKARELWYIIGIKILEKKAEEEKK